MRGRCNLLGLLRQYGPIKTVSTRENCCSRNSFCFLKKRNSFCRNTFLLQKKMTSQYSNLYTNTSNFLRNLLHTHLISNEKCLQSSRTSSLQKKIIGNTICKKKDTTHFIVPNFLNKKKSHLRIAKLHDSILNSPHLTITLNYCILTIPQIF